MQFDIPGYELHPGSAIDRASLVKFMQLTYTELFSDCALNHLAQTVDQYFSATTPLWWVKFEGSAIACLWTGVAIEQASGIRHAHIFLIYVKPAHRRQGIARSLMGVAEDQARAQGDRQIGLQVFVTNQPAIDLYERLGYKPQAMSMMKSLD
jgi:ribosomal protein S18 acetylase RimI-like enzyme